MKDLPFTKSKRKKTPKMTKKQVRSKVNKLIKQSQKKLADEIDKVLIEADMWYGRAVNPKNHNDRNGDQWVVDGLLGDEAEAVNVNDWLMTRDELETQR